MIMNFELQLLHDLLPFIKPESRLRWVLGVSINMFYYMNFELCIPTKKIGWLARRQTCYIKQGSIIEGCKVLTLALPLC